MEYWTTEVVASFAIWFMSSSMAFRCGSAWRSAQTNEWRFFSRTMRPISGRLASERVSRASG